MISNWTCALKTSHCNLNVYLHILIFEQYKRSKEPKRSKAHEIGLDDQISPCTFDKSVLFARPLAYGSHLGMPLVAPYCAIPRDYLSDTPLLRDMGLLVSQHGQLGAMPPPPFLSVFPLGEHAKWRCDTPPSKGVSQRYLRDTL